MQDLEEHEVPPYPIMHALTAELRREAARLGRGDLMSLWCGQGAALGTELPAADLVRRLDERSREVISGLPGGCRGVETASVTDGR